MCEEGGEREGRRERREERVRSSLAVKNWQHGLRMCVCVCGERNYRSLTGQQWERMRRGTDKEVRGCVLPK